MVLIPAAIIEELYHSRSMLDEFCSKAQYLVYAGGALPKQVGDEVSARIIRFNHCFGAEFRHHSENLYELILKKFR